MQKILLKFTLASAMLAGLFANCCASESYPSVHQELLDAMKAYRVPVVGYAIIKNNKIVLSETLSVDPRIKVSENSIFQAASISKSVSAYAALKLVSEGKLGLDDSVNDRLTTWKIPESEYDESYPVKVGQLLDMTSGLSVSGFPGHEQGKPLPTLRATLDGEPPANTPPVRVFYQPGSRYFYSGGAFQVLEQLIEDVSRQSFPVWAANKILQPLKMSRSTFQCPLDEAWRVAAVPGFLLDGTMLKGGWNNYAAASAGGLWSTPTDLAKFAISASDAYRGKDNKLVAKDIAKQMLMRRLHTDYGLGFVVNGNGPNLNFRKAGHNLGYHDQLIMFPNSGDGIVVMTNSENGEAVINYLVALVAQKYRWPCYFPYFDELITIPAQACQRG
jgi:CubicO group peptidase (beta-lactamase class C family)